MSQLETHEDLLGGADRVVFMMAGLLFSLRYRSALRQLHVAFEARLGVCSSADRVYCLLLLSIVAVTIIVALRLVLRHRRNTP